jgi:hypothetical protein
VQQEFFFIKSIIFVHDNGKLFISTYQKHSLKNRTGDRTSEAVGSGFYWSNHWFTGSLSGFLS